MLGLKLIHVSDRGPWIILDQSPEELNPKSCKTLVTMASFSIEESLLKFCTDDVSHPAMLGTKLQYDSSI